MTAPPPETLLLDRVGTPIGEATLVTDQAGRLRGLDWTDGEPRLSLVLKRQYPVVGLTPGRAPAAVRAAIGDYFAGRLEALDGISCAFGGSEFSRSVWAALRRIPVGCTLSYGALAASLGRPGGMRAVGRANGANPISLVAPCHRVIGADGGLTGYAGGLERKIWLLRHEGAWLN